jgi:hypothetical protein
MARRGRFTSPNSGGQNLTALITNLLRERNANEEQALLNAYRTGTAYNGSVPTADDIQAFYDQWASNAGYAPGSLEYQAIVQKKSDLNNYDIKKQYNTIINDFNNSSGANYNEIMNFLENVAGGSTDPQDLETYQSSISDIDKSYIGYQGEALSRGEITASEYRELAAAIIEQMDPSDPKRYEAIVNAYTYEWNAEKTKWDNRLRAGTINANQYANWAKGFQNALLAAGVKKDSVLYTTAVAAQVTADSGGGVGSGSVVSQRISTTLSEIDAIVDVALTLNPSTKPRSISDILDSGKDSLKAITDDPALILMLGQALDENPNGFPTLTALGITDSSSLNVYFNDRLTSGYADAYLLASNGGANKTKEWYNGNVAAGALSEVAQFDFQSTQWLSDIGEAKGNVAKIQELNGEWTKYLSGQDSKYGSLDATRLGDFLPLAQNEFDAMTGKSNGSLPTLSGTVNANIPLDFTTVQQNTDNIIAMTSGNGYQQWNEKNQEFEFVAGRPAGRTDTGSYQFIEFARVNGEIISYVTSVQGTKVSDKNGDQVGWVYDRQDGSAPIISNMGGRLIETPEAGLNGNKSSGFVVPDGTTLTVTDKPVPLYNVTGLATTRTVTVRENSRDDAGFSRSGITQTESTISPDDLRAASGLVANVLPALGGSAASGANIATDILAEADRIQIGQISVGPNAMTPLGRAEIARLSGNTELEKAWLFVEANKDKLEIVNGGWQWKAGTQESTQEGTNPFGNALVGVGLGAIAGAPVAGVGAIPGAIAGGIGGFVQGALNYRQSPRDYILDVNRQILNNDPAMDAQRKQYYYGKPALPLPIVSPSATSAALPIGDRFFRKLSPTGNPEVPMVRPGIPDVSVVVPKPAIPAPVTPPVNPMTQKYGSAAFQEVTPVAPVQSTVRRGLK